ncbi:hypothetical protein CHS0354_003033 [Potamilus streckersoni]|uniref:FERM domain-containing protein n=1 Tax=Potamilus streckersoni TaxID=2493646 RepID=A0AAE0TBX6_9BIVA|nr:hypothetical protein CHS0354_003033 [Potamilus streckersoni]
MSTLLLRISIISQGSVEMIRKMQFDPATVVFRACHLIRDGFNQAGIPTPQGNVNEFGLFLSDDDPKKGIWLDPSLTLEHYCLRRLDLVKYRKRMRIVKIRTMDDAVRKFKVDDTNTVGQLMLTICSRIGITNHDEYSLILEMSDDEKQKTLTLRRQKSIAKDQRKLEQMRKKLHTEDYTNWLDHSKTLREQGVAEENTLLLRRRFFFSDKAVDAQDPIQLNLLFSQTRDAILKGTHPVSKEKATVLASLQCQIQFGDHNKQRNKPGFLDLKEFLPKEYCRVKNIEKNIFQECKKWIGFTEMDAKVKYTQMCQDLKTYGIAFFLVKEIMKGKSKLVPRLLGISKESVVRVDENTKEILTTWPITMVRRWTASPNSFTLDFGDYADAYYSVQTQEGEQMVDLIAGYIDIIVRKQKSKEYNGTDDGDEVAIYEEIVYPPYFDTDDICPGR